MVLVIAMITLLALVFDFMIDGVPRISVDFLINYPSRRPEQAGILSAWVGTSLVMLTTAMLAVPIGVAAGVYLEEYAPKNWLTDIIEINVTNLAGVPSIIYGLLALGLFVQTLRTRPDHPGRRHDACAADPADHHRGDARGVAQHPARDPRGRLSGSAPTNGRWCGCICCRRRVPAS